MINFEIAILYVDCRTEDIRSNPNASFTVYRFRDVPLHYALDTRIPGIPEYQCPTLDAALRFAVCQQSFSLKAVDFVITLPEKSKSLSSIYVQN